MKRAMNHLPCLIAISFSMLFGSAHALEANAISIRDCVIDAKDAIRYLAKNSDTLKLDRTRFYSMGDSVGGADRANVTAGFAREFAR